MSKTAEEYNKAQRRYLSKDGVPGPGLRTLASARRGQMTGREVEVFVVDGVPDLAEPKVLTTKVLLRFYRQPLPEWDGKDGDAPMARSVTVRMDDGRLRTSVWITPEIAAALRECLDAPNVRFTTEVSLAG